MANTLFLVIYLGMADVSEFKGIEGEALSQFKGEHRLAVILPRRCCL
jgi:hypothetical protein